MTTQSFPADSVKQFPGTAFNSPIGTVSVLMKTNKYYTDGSLKSTGNTYSVTKEWGKLAVEKGWATDVDGVFPETPAPTGSSSDGFSPIAYTDIATTTGVLGQSYQVVGGDDDGARLIWTTSAADTVPSWRWWAWPDSTYL